MRILLFVLYDIKFSAYLEKISHSDMAVEFPGKGCKEKLAVVFSAQSWLKASRKTDKISFAKIE